MESESAFKRRWEMRRSLYRWMLFSWFALLAFFVGPKFFLWFWDVKPAPSRAEDFVPVVQRLCVPVVRKMKQYHREHGVWPKEMKDCYPGFTGPDHYRFSWQLTDKNTKVFQFLFYDELRETVEYDFTPGKEKWSVEGPFVTADIPLPPVEIDDPALPTSNPVAK
jgi:hypothetical protein